MPITLTGDREGDRSLPVSLGEVPERPAAPSPVTRIRLADFLEAHARQVLADADALRALFGPS
jgi:hypothetical protein